MTTRAPVQAAPIVALRNAQSMRDGVPAKHVGAGVPSGVSAWASVHSAEVFKRQNEKTVRESESVKILRWRVRTVRLQRSLE